MRRFCQLTLSSALSFVLAGTQPLLAQVPSGPCNILCLSQRARAALAAGRYTDYLQLARQVAARAPDHTGGSYAVARAFALVGQRDSALAWLSHHADLGGALDIATDSAFAAFRDTPAFRAVQSRLEANAAPIIRGKPAFSLPDPDLLPEALAWDSARRVWLVGSLARRKVIRVSADGSVASFITSPDILRVVGIHIDPTRDIVWFATWAPADNPMAGERLIRTRLFKADPSTGRILRSYEPTDTLNSHLFNDLAITPEGTVYITDTHQGWLYRIVPESDSLEVFLRPDPNEFTGANGITLTDDARTLYVAYIEGIMRVELGSRQFSRLRSPAGISTSGIDGLYWYRGDLIGVQNARGLERVVRFALDDDGDAVRLADVLERSSELMDVPTTGEIVGTAFYYIANSQANRLDAGNRLAPARVTPPPVTVVRVIDLETSARRRD